MLASILDVASHVGYPIVFLLIAIETIGVPVPGETALVLAAIAAIVGDNIGFALGRKLGRRVLLAPGPLLHHRRRLLAVGEPFFDRHGPKAVFLGRWTTGLRITAAWLAGANKMSWTTFLFWNALGGIAWAASVGLLAYWLGHRAESLLRAVGLGGAAAVVLVGTALWFVLRWRRRRAAALVEAEARAGR